MFIENTCQLYEFDWVKNRINPGSHVLDLGYGDGLFLESISDFNHVTLVEGSSELVEVARSRVKKLNLNVNVINSLFEDFSPNVQFDIVVASHVLEHVDDPRYLLTKIKTWLKPKGLLICIVPNRESLHRRLGLKMGMISKLDELSDRDKVVGHQRVYSLKDLELDLSRSGFQTLESRGFFTKALSNAQMLGLSKEVIFGLCQLSEDLPPEMGANLGVVAISGEKIGN